jgi:uncharacterized membrane protein
MIVHFPVALFPVSIGLYAAGKFLDNQTMFQAAFYCLIAGVALGWIAGITGIIDLFLNIVKHGKDAIRRAYLHGSVQATVLTGFTIIASVQYKNPSLIAALPTWMLVIEISLVIALFVGNYLGGELLLKYVSRDFHG